MQYTSHKAAVMAAMKLCKHEFCDGVGVLAVANAQNLTKVDTGNLKRSETYEVIPGDAGVIIGVTAAAPYGLTIEKGLAGHKAQPFLEPGALQSIPQIINVAERLYRSHLGGD